MAPRSRKSQSSSVWSAMPCAPRQPPTRWITASICPAAAVTSARSCRTSSSRARSHTKGATPSPACCAAADPLQVRTHGEDPVPGLAQCPGHGDAGRAAAARDQDVQRRVWAAGDSALQLSQGGRSGDAGSGFNDRAHLLFQCFVEHGQREFVIEHLVGEAARRTRQRQRFRSLGPNRRRVGRDGGGDQLVGGQPVGRFGRSMERQYRSSMLAPRAMTASATSSQSMVSRVSVQWRTRCWCSQANSSWPPRPS